MVSFSYCEEIPVEENEVNDSSSKSSIETKPDASPQLPKKSVTNSTLTSTASSEAPVSVCEPAAPPLGPEVLASLPQWQGLWSGQGQGLHCRQLPKEAPGEMGLLPLTGWPSIVLGSRYLRRRICLASEQMKTIQVHRVSFTRWTPGPAPLGRAVRSCFHCLDLKTKSYMNIRL